MAINYASKYAQKIDEKFSREALTDGAVSVIDLMLLAKLIPSKGEGRRLIQQGGVLVNEEKVDSIDRKVTAEDLASGLILRKGKKVFHRFIK